ncbi:MAG: hypothetical protein NVSMB51_10350 [Solirubrobacteraceae bacterium]
MSSRLEEKQRRKAEREAAEQQAARDAGRARRLRIGGGALVGLAVIAGIALAVSSSGGGGSSSSTNAASSPVANDIKGVVLPARQISSLTQAAAAAGCQLHSYPIEGRSHVSSIVAYKTNPPTSGNHNPVPAPDGVYDKANTPAKENFVHSLEHGRVEIQYKPGAQPAQVKQLEALWNETVKSQPGYKQLLFQNNTGMPYALAAVAWGQALDCPAFNAKVFDAVRAFRDTYLDKGPELLPPG